MTKRKGYLEEQTILVSVSPVVRGFGSSPNMSTNLMGVWRKNIRSDDPMIDTKEGVFHYEVSNHLEVSNLSQPTNFVMQMVIRPIVVTDSNRGIR